ncbi:glycosyl transferase [Acidihalobacter aeolianus]|uniref:Glycosyl transferase n=1 Tax=Acidihalobacter aeolianus TaxID=2792603 RepID=A0A1D8KAC5_9GAMM|nr:glycosyltransferase family 2 protein [Acidihalobacter aeolianus]AOV17891.1 glycosyl transferase [Acidihalobacter aeolianus]
MSKQHISIVIPARNEAAHLEMLVGELRRRHPDAEILLISDGSTDRTAEVAIASGATRVIEHPYAIGNGGAIKTGARQATGEIIVFMDADGQHKPADVAPLIERLCEGFDMVVGARSAGSQASLGRLAANTLYNRLASWVTGHPVLDLTSGFRAVRASRFRQFLYLLPNGFSYPTTATMAFFRAGYSVAYLPIEALRREGKSHVKPLRDGIRFLLIIFKIGTLYSPLKVFVPAAVFFFALGLIRYIYTYLYNGTFTNMSVLLFITGALVFLLGLISEQIANLMYARTDIDSP